ncbi:MAG: 30S ribosomal protein S17 [Planctomycetes bacterium]|nr:30S ribosomal protein S17 [Planctomycetota bacterium]
MSETRNNRKTVVGVVTSDKMAKTITVKSERLVMHPTFRKYVKRYTTYKAHDENSDAKVGDYVELTECRPLSKSKFFRLTRIIRRGKAFQAAQGAES